MQAGLGQSVEAGGLKPVWDKDDSYLELPVYYSWTFATGLAGDFEALVSRLKNVALDPLGLQGRTLGLTGLRAILQLPATVPGSTVLPGALGGAAAVDVAIRDGLRALLDLSAPTAATPGAGALALPTYGRWHAVHGAGWPAQLNLQPSARAVAAIGTRIVQDQQDNLMTAAWQQAGEIQAANRLLRRSARPPDGHRDVAPAGQRARGVVPADDRRRARPGP